MGGQWQGVAVEDIKLPPAALSALPDFYSLFCFFLQNNFPGFVCNCPQGRWPEKHMKPNLSSHKYNLILKKSFSPLSIHLRNTDAPGMQVLGVSLSREILGASP